MDENGRYADTRTPEQKASLWYLLKELRQTYPKARIVGHRDFPKVAKECPCFDAQTEYADLNKWRPSRGTSRWLDNLISVFYIFFW